MAISKSFLSMVPLELTSETHQKRRLIIVQLHRTSVWQLYDSRRTSWWKMTRRKIFIVVPAFSTPRRTDDTNAYARRKKMSVDTAEKLPPTFFSGFRTVFLFSLSESRGFDRLRSCTECTIYMHVLVLVLRECVRGVLTKMYKIFRGKPLRRCENR